MEGGVTETLSGLARMESGEHEPREPSRLRAARYFQIKLLTWILVIYIYAGLILTKFSETLTDSIFDFLDF